MARFHQKKAEELKEGLAAYLPDTIHHYNEIVDVISSKNIPLICMQYPLRSIAPLEKIFWTSHPVIFVENKINFETVLKQGSYFELFSDSFAGDFGHCTYRGNELIAQNLAQVILSEIVKKK
jgi:hypothetical protein